MATCKTPDVELKMSIAEAGHLYRLLDMIDNDLAHSILDPDGDINISMTKQAIWGSTGIKTALYSILPTVDRV
jgi:hypothetical protein